MDLCQSVSDEDRSQSGGDERSDERVGTGAFAGAPVVAGATLGDGSLPFAVPLQLFGGDFLYLAVVFFVLALVAAVVGARGVAGLSMTIAKWLVIVFLVLAVVALIL